jgi:hypothetical protein
LSSLRCFFFAIRLRRFLMTEPMNNLSTTETSTSLGLLRTLPGFRRTTLACYPERQGGRDSAPGADRR